MIEKSYIYKVIRGATTATGNSVEEIENAVIELINELISRNKLNSKIYYQLHFLSQMIWMHVFLLQLQEKVMALIKLHF